MLKFVEKSVCPRTSKPYYTFENRGVVYTIIEDETDIFSVWTTRKALGTPNLQVMNRKQMDFGAKVYQDFLAYLELEELDFLEV